MRLKTSDLEKLMKEALLSYGFVKPGGYHVRTRPENSCFLEEAGVCYAWYRTATYIIPYLGVYNVKLADLYTRFSGSKNKYSFSLLTQNIGYVGEGHEYKDWRYQEEQDAQTLIKEVAKMIHESSSFFYQQNADVNTLISKYEARVYPISKENRFLFLPMLYLVAGMPEKGIRFYADEIANGWPVFDTGKKVIKQYNDYVAHHFRGVTCIDVESLILNRHI